MNQSDIEKLMEKFLRGGLSPSEYGRLEQLAGEDAAFAKEWETCKFQKQALQEITANDLRQKMTEWDKEASRPNPLIKWLPSLGLLVVGAIAAWYFFKNNDMGVAHKVQPTPSVILTDTVDTAEPSFQPTADEEKEETEIEQQENQKKQPERIPPPPIAYHESAKRFFEKPVSLLVGNRGQGQQDVLRSALQSVDSIYQKGNLKLAIEKMASLVADNPGNSRLQLSLGKLYFENGEYEKAIPIIQEVATKPSMNKKDAEWHLLLSYMAAYSYHKENFEKLLGKMLEEKSHPFYEKALLVEQEVANW